MKLNCVDPLLITAGPATGLGEPARLKSLVFFIGSAADAVPIDPSLETLYCSSFDSKDSIVLMLGIGRLNNNTI